MNKYVMVIVLMLGLTSCSEKNEHYYLTHPEALLSAVKACPVQQSQGLTCSQLSELANRLNILAYQLQYSPQGFGVKILSLQQTLSSQALEIEKNAANAELKASMALNQKDLADRLAVVKWLESPKS
ncbi:MAG: hypothetical protein EPN84_00040 [Legionella sp.]|nr:MAG: hypothetical protein EPN84_00040 [Legionella sp.]